MRLRLLAEVEEEAESARQYLNRQSAGLGDRFLDDPESTLAAVRSHAESFPRLETLPDSEPYRRALLQVFRYAVIFECMADETLVVAIAHANREPNDWLRRRINP